MSESNSLLKNGLTVIILRQDGRTHPAVISNIDSEQEIVTVEWEEAGITKGKELDLLTLYALNPSLIPLNNENHYNEDFKPVKNKNKFTSKNDSKYFVKYRIETIKSHNEFGSNSCNGTYNISSSRSDGLIENKQSCRTSTQSNISSPLTGSKKSKRSSVVIEIEKLKKSREDRRLRQMEIKQNQETFKKTYSSSNDNWYFLKMIKEYQSSIKYIPLKEDEPLECTQITVCVRKRPLNKKELINNEIDVISIPKKDLILVHEPKNKVDLTKYLDNQSFSFDYVFDENCSNEMVYKYSVKPLVKSIFKGGMTTCFAYGQTGSGKTHTMGGNFIGKKQNYRDGIYFMVVRDIFSLLLSSQYNIENLYISTSFFEIYQGKVFDLLANKAQLKILENAKQKVQIVGLTEKKVSSVEDVISLLQIGNTSRASGKTSANINSSRSHAVFQVVLKIIETNKIYGKMSLIDLAGNERGVDILSANKSTQMEGAEINKSLLALKECIRALSKRGPHLPFRQSKLTQVLKDSFIGDNSKICMIAMISPGMSSCEHTLNTLRYADRVKELVPSDTIAKEIVDNKSTNQENVYAKLGECSDEGFLQKNVNDKVIKNKIIINELETSLNKSCSKCVSIEEISNNENKCNLNNLQE